MIDDDMTDDNVIEDAGWKLGWLVSETSGIRIVMAEFEGRRVLHDGCLPYVTVDHQRQDIDPDDAEPDGHGPWWFPLGVHSLVGPVDVEGTGGGFELVADFVNGPYRYTQMWRFSRDGTISPWLTIHGPGLTSAHTYHVYWRLDLDLDGALDDAVEAFTDSGFERITEEGWLPCEKRDEHGTAWRQLDLSSRTTASIQPPRGEDAELYVLKNHLSQQPPFTPRPITGDDPFPTGHRASERIEGQDISLWYAAHVHRSESFPLTCGPTIRVSFR